MNKECDCGRLSELIIRPTEIRYNNKTDKIIAKKKNPTTNKDSGSVRLIQLHLTNSKIVIFFIRSTAVRVLVKILKQRQNTLKKMRMHGY